MTAGGPQRKPRAAPDFWVATVLALVFVLLGLVFLAAPRLGAMIFGIPAPEGVALTYVAALGLRDLAFGLYLLVLARRSTRHVLGLIFAATLLIPVGDTIIVAAQRGLSAPFHLLLHGGSALTMAAAAVWLLRRSSHSSPEDKRP